MNVCVCAPCRRKRSVNNDRSLCSGPGDHSAISLPEKWSPWNCGNPFLKKIIKWLFMSQFEFAFRKKEAKTLADESLWFWINWNYDFNPIALWKHFSFYFNNEKTFLGCIFAFHGRLSSSFFACVPRPRSSLELRQCRKTGSCMTGVFVFFCRFFLKTFFCFLFPCNKIPKLTQTRNGRGQFVCVSSHINEQPTSPTA